MRNFVTFSMFLLAAVVSAAFGAYTGAFIGFDPVSGATVCGSASVLSGLMPGGVIGISMGVRPMTASRALYHEIQEKNAANGLSSTTELPGYLRAEVVLAQQNQIQFFIGTNEAGNGQQIQTFENRLNLNDAFYVTHFGVMFYDFLTAEGSAARSRARLQTFPNTNVFAANAPELVAAYNGKLSLRVDDTVFIDSMDMLRFQNAKTAQQGQAVSAVALTGVTDQSDWSQNDMFCLSVDPLVRLNGPGKNVFRIDLPDNLDFTLEADHSVAAVLYLRGWLSQNGGAMRTANGR